MPITIHNNPANLLRGAIPNCPGRERSPFRLRHFSPPLSYGKIFLPLLCLWLCSCLTILSAAPGIAQTSSQGKVTVLVTDWPQEMLSAEPLRRRCSAMENATREQQQELRRMEAEFWRMQEPKTEALIFQAENEWTNRCNALQHSMEETAEEGRKLIQELQKAKEKSATQMEVLEFFMQCETLVLQALSKQREMEAPLQKLKEGLHDRFQWLRLKRKRPAVSPAPKKQPKSGQPFRQKRKEENQVPSPKPQIKRQPTSLFPPSSRKKSGFQSMRESTP